MYLAQGHNKVQPVRLEHATSQSQKTVKEVVCTKITFIHKKTIFYIPYIVQVGGVPSHSPVAVHSSVWFPVE